MARASCRLFRPFARSTGCHENETEIGDSSPASESRQRLAAEQRQSCRRGAHKSIHFVAALNASRLEQPISLRLAGQLANSRPDFEPASQRSSLLWREQSESARDKEAESEKERASGRGINHSHLNGWPSSRPGWHPREATRRDDEDRRQAQAS